MPKKRGNLLVQTPFYYQRTRKPSYSGTGFSEGLSKSSPSRPNGTGLSGTQFSLHEDTKYRKEVPRINGLRKNKINSRNKSNLKTIKRNNKLFQALNLPTICNINPRSVYNKSDEFCTFVEQEEVDVIFMSESWERDYLSLDQIIKLEDHTIISNVSQRTGTGGRPAIFANHKKFEVQNITNTLVQIPWGVEAVWCVLTPKNVTNYSKNKKNCLLCSLLKTFIKEENPSS